VRWGNDGVGLQFVLNDGGSPSKGKEANLGGIDKNELERFLMGVLKIKE
jgi:hypothetical protein